ncbi:MAG: 5'-methylthioadenosine/adenosylhomocysteine nucleosidase [Alphaproteobacteria bacterium]
MTVEFGIIAAMQEECEALKAMMDAPAEHKIGNKLFLEGTVLGRNIVVLQCGIGKVNGAVGATLMIEKFTPKYIINTGSAGGFAKDLQVGDIIVSEKIAYHDVDLTSFGYKIGQMAGEPVDFTADASLVETLQHVSPSDKSKKMRTGMIVSGDSFISEKGQFDKIQSNFPAADVIEMEAAAIAHTCHIFQTPFLAIRSVSDIVYEEGNQMDFQEFLPIAAKNSLDILSQILQKHPK